MSTTPTGKEFVAAIYVRVSTQDQNQSMQISELKAYAKRQGWRVVEYLEKASSIAVRPVFNKLIQDARERKVDAVLVWKLDRFARSVHQLTQNLEVLDQANVRFICVTQGIDTDKQSLGGRLLMQILGAIAEFERGLIRERVKAGMTEAKRVGKHVGRPEPIWDRERAAELRRAGVSYRKIAKVLGQPIGSLHRAMEKLATA